MFYIYNWTKQTRGQTSCEEGFSLVEIMIALIVIGVIGSAILPLIKSQHELHDLRTTHGHQDRILYALAAFVQTHGRLPCPSDPGDPQRLGYERLRCQRPEHASGIVPFKTLGLSERTAKNGHQTFFAYVVHPQLTMTRDLQEYCRPDLKHLVHVKTLENLPFDPVAIRLSEKFTREETVTKELSFLKMAKPLALKERWETRKNLISFYGHLFCPAATSSPSLED